MEGGVGNPGAVFVWRVMYKNICEQKLWDRVNQVGVLQQKTLIEEVASTVIRDKLVDPKCMVFSPSNQKLIVTYVPDVGSTETVSIHNHALGQLCDKSAPNKEEPQIMRKQMWSLLEGEDWHRDLLAKMFNAFYSMGEFVDRRKGKGKFLNRIVGSELRGFLSRSFNRNLNTATSLRTFLEACSQFGAGPYESHSTSVRTRLKCVLPQVFEPISGEFVAFGVSYSNSDFGAGTLDISNFFLRLNSLDVQRNLAGQASVLESGFSRTHLGSVIQESDIELSDDTANKEVETVNSAIRDVVSAQLSIDAIERTLEAIRVADRNEMPWKTLRELLASVLNKNEVDVAKSMLEMGVQDLPMVTQRGEEAVATNWWASNLVGWFADKEQNPDRKAELQAFAGDMLSKGIKQ